MKHAKTTDYQLDHLSTVCSYNVTLLLRYNIIDHTIYVAIDLYIATGKCTLHFLTESHETLVKSKNLYAKF